MDTPKTLNGGVEPYKLSTAERRKGAETTNRIKRERAMTARQRLAKKFDEDFDGIVGPMFEAAKAGDVQAFRALFEHAFGKAPQAIELSGPDGEPVRVEQRGVSLVAVAHVLRDAGALPAELGPGAPGDPVPGPASIVEARNDEVL